MSGYTITDGISVVSMMPEWDLKMADAKIETVNRTRSGAMYRYKWGAFQRVSFSVEFLSSSDMTVINSWWGANVPVVIYDINSSVVHSGYLVNGSAPIDSYLEPYTTYYRGTIELETF